jgi:hypothetical protein
VSSVREPSEVITFRSEAEWFAWLDQHPEGFFVVRAPRGRFRLHRSKCLNFDRKKVWSDGRINDWGKNPKFCHGDESVLAAWVIASSGTEPLRCKTRNCFPD